MPRAKKIINTLILDEAVINKIYLIRGYKVMLDRDLSEMYGVETKRLKEAVKRNIERFPSDFMFTLTQKEFQNLRSQIASSSSITAARAGWGGIRHLPTAFTEQGVAMISGVLNSAVAIRVNIHIIRVFTKMRELLLTHKDILLKLEKMERDVTDSKQDIAKIFGALRLLLNPPATKRRAIGFNRKDDE